MTKTNPRYPIYVVSKGRWKERHTIRALERMGLRYRVAVEPQEVEQYASVIPRKRLLVLPRGSNGEGPTYARNICWEHARKRGAFRHWVMDDNIDGFYRLNHNKKRRADTGAIFRAAEDFVDRYENVPLAGFNYFKFCLETERLPPFVLNTRIYSCLLVQCDIPYRWRGRYNEDTDLSLRILKDGFCTIQFNAFLQEKITTQRIAGGNTAEFYEHEGTLPKSQYLADLHPDVARVVWRFGRWHHYVDYSPFKRNQLIRRSDIQIEDRINEYGMKLVSMKRRQAHRLPQ